MRYRVRRIGIGSLAWQGAVAGGLLALPPALAITTGLRFAAHALRLTLESWRAVRVGMPPVTTTLNFADLLHVTPLLTLLRQLDNASVALFAAFVAACVLLGALAGMVTCALVALLFNIGARPGGLVVEMEPLDRLNDDTRLQQPIGA